MDKLMLPKYKPLFLDESNLPAGYYDEVNPHGKREACTINVRKLSQYIKDNNCDVTDITEDEAEFLKN